MIEAIAWIVAETVGPVPDSAAKVERAERHLYLSTIKRHIEVSLNSSSLTANHLCRHFRISRASLYRLFEADGGLARFIQEQRLNRALKQLVSPLWQGRDLINLAADLQFSSASTFIRAFRRRFDVTPGEFRELAEAWHDKNGTLFETAICSSNDAASRRSGHRTMAREVDRRGSELLALLGTNSQSSRRAA